MLTVRNLSAAYGKRAVLEGVDIDVSAGEILAILGRNGSGKSTLLKAIAGIVPAAADRLEFDGRDITRWPIHRRAAAGVALLRQTQAVFPSLSVGQNLGLTSGEDGPSPGLDDPLFATLYGRLGVRAGLLSGGQQRLLGLAMVLSRRPRLLLLDEPAAGLAPQLAKEVFTLLTALAHRLRIGVFMVEQNVVLAASIANRLLHMEGGRPVSWQRPSLDGATMEDRLNHQGTSSAAPEGQEEYHDP